MINFSTIQEGILNVDDLSHDIDIVARYPFIQKLVSLANTHKNYKDPTELAKLMDEIKQQCQEYKMSYGKACKAYQKFEGVIFTIREFRWDPEDKSKLSGVLLNFTNNWDYRYPQQIKWSNVGMSCGCHFETRSCHTMGKLRREIWENIFFLPMEVWNYLKQISGVTLRECDCATPANTMGIGNPMAPTDTQPGSGDIPNAGIAPKKKKKALKDCLRASLNEGIFDVDDLSGNIDNYTKDSGILDVLKKYPRPYSIIPDSEMQSLIQTIANIKALDDEKTSIIARLRKKDNTAVIYHPKLNLRRWRNVEAIEVRAFVKNPRPYSVFFIKQIYGWERQRVSEENHYSQISRDVAKYTCFISPGAWNEIVDEPQLKR